MYVYQENISIMIKTHIAAIGMHAGEYVPCRAKYVPCRIAGKNEHVYFADEESIQEFNELNDEVQRNIWREESDNTDNTENTENIHAMMSTLQSGPYRYYINLRGQVDPRAL